MLQELLAVIVPLLVCAAVGFSWSRVGLDYPVDFVTRVVMNIGAPCLIVSSFSEAGIDAARLADLALATLLLLSIMGLAAGALVKLLRLPAVTFVPPVVFANVGNMGLPLCYFAFGDQGLALALAVFLVVFTLQMSLGQMFVAGKGGMLVLVRQPVLWATLIAVVLVMTDTRLPTWLVNTTGLLGDLTIPLMLITLGVSLASLKVTEWRLSLIFSLLRVAGGFGAGWAVAGWLGLEGVERGVLILQASMPVAVFNYLLALRYRRDPGEVAAMVVVSTLLAFALLPLIVAYVLQ
jgi:predicted permease